MSKYSPNKNYNHSPFKLAPSNLNTKKQCAKNIYPPSKTKNIQKQSKLLYPETVRKQTHKYQDDPQNHPDQTNAQLFRQLEQKDRKIKILQKRLEDQQRNETQTLQMIEHEKNIFIGETDRRIDGYEHQILSLKKQMAKILTKNQNLQQNTKSFPIKHEQNKMSELLSEKEKEMKHIYQLEVQGLNNQINKLHNEIMRLTNAGKAALSEQQYFYENIIYRLNQQFEKQKNLLTVYDQLQIKKINHELAKRKSQISQIQEKKQKRQIQNSIRERELLQKKSKLESQILASQDFYRKQAYREAERLKELNSIEIKNLQVSNNSIVKNLQSQIKKLLEVNELKKKQICAITKEKDEERKSFNQRVSQLEDVIMRLNRHMKQSERNHLQESQLLKVKLAELREVDINSLKDYYENEIRLLNEQLSEKEKDLKNIRNKLQEQLQEKNDIRKQFNIQIIDLNNKIKQLKVQLAEADIIKKEQNANLSSNMQLTSVKLSREAAQKIKMNNFNDEEKKKLQQLIDAKDKENDELNKKIEILKANNLKEVQVKDEAYGLIEEEKKELQRQLRKQKYFYENEINKKNSIFKIEKEQYETEIAHLKNTHQEQFNKMMIQLSKQKASLEVEVSKYKQIQKQLRDDLDRNNQFKKADIDNKDRMINEQKRLISEQKQKSQQTLVKYYQNEIELLQKEVKTLRLKLQMKEQDLRNQTERYSQLERKMDQVIQSQEKLKNMQNKIIELGQDNNLIRNMASIVRRRA